MLELSAAKGFVLAWVESEPLDYTTAEGGPEGRALTGGVSPVPVTTLRPMAGASPEGLVRQSPSEQGSRHVTETASGQAPEPS